MTPGLLVRYRVLWLVLCLVISALLASALSSIRFDTRISVLLGDNDAYVNDRDQLAAEFPNRQDISIAVSSASGATNVFSAPILEALGALHREYRRIPYTTGASSVVAYDSPFGEIGLFPGRFRNFHEIDAKAMQAAREKAMADRFINGILVSPGADLALFSAPLSLSTSTSAQNREIADAISAVLRDLRQAHPNVAFAPGAEALFETSTRDAMIQDLTRLLPLVILVCVLFICYCFQSVRHGACILLVTLLTIICTVGTLAWADIALNSVSVMAPLVVVIIAVANTAHILSVFRQQLADGVTSAQAMQQSLAFNLRPVSLAALTTAIGFASLNYASAPAISQFGSIVALGVVFAWLLSFLSFPALVMMAGTAVNDIRLANAFLRYCQHLVAHYHRVIFYGVIVAGLIAAALLPLNKPDFDRLDFIDQDSPLHAYYALLSERMQRGTVMNYGIVANNPANSTPLPDGAIDPEFLQRVDELSVWLRQRPDVLDAASLVDVVKTINDTLEGSQAGDNVDNYRLPESAELVEQHLMNYVSVQQDSYALANFINTDFSTIRLFITTTPLSNQGIIDLDVAIGEFFTDAFAGDAMRLMRGSSTLLFARMDRTVTVELIQSYLISLVMITAALTIGLRSLYFGLVSVVPNLLPATLVFGLWGLLVGTVDPFVMMLFSISIGLVVDDTVHILSTYQRQRQQGLPVDSAIQAAVTKAGPALAITTAVLALGALILLMASTLYFQQAARLLVPIVVLALILDLTFLPVLLSRLEKARERLAARRQQAARP
ncbi:efflux RND transporter permease subunit [Pseudohongiella acticola]|uniref:efflux RND transporter permease subunit n=1 Tax=Pseudohongiella acticola TaxID=1524254 RepID=UPI0030EF79B1